MNGELAQIVALVGHGNLFLHSGEASVPELSHANSAFQYVSSVRFARYRNREQQQGVEVAAGVADWFAFLRSVEARRLWNIAFAWQREDLPEHAAVAFAGGVPRAIQADLPEGYELWYPQWRPGGPDQKPWLVEYRSPRFDDSHAVPLADLNVVKAQLRQAIARAEVFARRPEVGAATWADGFAAALRLLDAPSPEPPFHQDMLPERGYGLAAHQLLAAAGQAWVFGGMGSWNDRGFAAERLQQEYEDVTQALYGAVKTAIVMASNAFEPT